MTPPKPPRAERERQLRERLKTPVGRAEVARLFAACFPPGQKPPPGRGVIDTILTHEYGPRPDDSAGRDGVSAP